MTRLVPLLAAAASLAHLSGEAPRRFERSRDYDVEHYRIELRFDEKAHSFQGQTVITLWPLRDGFDTCELDAETFTVTAVKDQQGSLRFQQKPGKLLVWLRRPHHYREKLAFAVDYDARNVNVDPEKYGMAKGYDLGLGFKDETPEHPRLINTLSFPEGARHWFPSNDQPSDKATAEIVATVKQGDQAIANGRLASVTRSGADSRFTWVQDQPLSTYLFALVAGPYVKVSDTNGSLPVNYWVYPKDVKDAKRSFGKTREIIRFFESEFGVAYPWAKYDQITIPRFGGGAESTSATVIGDGTIHDEKSDKDFPSHWLVAHEAAHQWWGDLITMRDWSETWLNESFATYGEYLYSKHSLGEDEGALNMLLKRNQYLEEARTKFRRPIVFDRWEVPNDNFNRHTYQKGAAVLHMLRWVMGDKDYQRAMSHFLKKHAYQAVDTHDLRKAIRESSGQSLDWFFEQWLYQEGHPVFDVRWEWRSAEGRVRLTVAQKQLPLFETPVDVGVTTAAGKKIERLRIGKTSEQVFDIQCDGKPLLVHFDEGNHLLMEMTFDKSVEELQFQLKEDDAMGRMWAASQLKARGAEAALRKAAREDRFWAVRRAAVESLDADAAFMREAAKDVKPEVRAAAVGKLGAPEDAAFLAERFEKEDSYVVQAEALKAIGRCGDKGQVALLREAARMPSPRDLLKRAAEQALRELAGDQGPESHR